MVFQFGDSKKSSTVMFAIMEKKMLRTSEFIRTKV